MQGNVQNLTVVDITSFFSTTCGGVRRYYEEKAKWLPRPGVACHYIVPGPTDSDERMGNATLHRVAGPPQFGNPAYHRFTRAGRLNGLLRELAPDIVELGSHYRLPGIVRRATAGLPTPPRLVGFFHSHPQQMAQNITTFLPGNPAPLLARPLWRFFAARHAAYDATLVASQHVESRLQRLGVPNVHRVGLGVDTEAFAPTTEPVAPFFTYAGRFTRDKELPLLLAACDRALPGTGLSLRLVGNGPLRPWLENAARTRAWLQVEAARDAAAEVAALLRQSVAVVVPSQTETFSFATAEAMACGTPVVGPAAGAVGELVRGSGCGFVFTPDRADSMAAALMRAHALTTHARDRLAQAGRAYVLNQFRWPMVTNRILDVYTQVMSRQNALAGMPVRLAPM